MLDGRRVFVATNIFVTNRPPTISVAATSPTASRVGPEPGVFTLSRTSNTNYPISINYVFGGTASSGVDYQTPPASITLAAGASSTNLAILPMGGTNLIAAKTVIIALSSNPSYVVGTSNRATVTIAGNSGPITSIRMSNGVATINWASVNARVYQVLSKNTLSATNWTILSPSVTANSPVTAWADTTASGSRQRFYRISQIAP